LKLDLRGKSCLVTGGSQGLGRAICIGLASEGVNVAVNYRSNEQKAIDALDGYWEQFDINF